jgi:hypothetical protein
VKPVARAFYNEPVVFLGIVQAVNVACVGVLYPYWIGGAVLAGLTLLQRRFVKPFRVPGRRRRA